jgi:hypothetical protein
MPVNNLKNDKDSIKIEDLTSSNVNPATEEKQDDIITAIGNIGGGVSYNYVKSEETGTYKYYGFSSTTGWQIKRKTLATGIWEIAYEDYTETYANFDAAWTARAVLVYTYA